MHLFSKYNKIYLFFLFLLLSTPLIGQITYPMNDGDRVCYNVQIEFHESYLSGMCIMKNQEGDIIASVVNEFGISLIDFTYSEKKDKVKIYRVIKPLNRWYIKRALKRGIKNMLKMMKLGGSKYIDKKNNLTYIFTLNET